MSLHNGNVMHHQKCVRLTKTQIFNRDRYSFKSCVPHNTIHSSLDLSLLICVCRHRNNTCTREGNPNAKEFDTNSIQEDILHHDVDKTANTKGNTTAPRLPRVVVATIATGRYRALGIQALGTAYRHFGGDCIPSFHLLTDNATGVPPHLNPAFAPYRAWPDSGLSKYEDILHGIRSAIESADYFFFIDADVAFHEDVALMDIAGDIVGVEHPMYPRNNAGWCERKDGQALCGYPYDRNPKSHAYIPPEIGKFFYTTVGGHGVVRKYMVSSSWYLQSALWGGKTTFLLEMLVELAHRVKLDRAANIYSMTVQDERYFNYYVWRESHNSSKNIRVLPHAFLYPFRNEGFGDWVTKHNRPIVYHGTKVPGKLNKGEVEIQVDSTNECLGFLLDPLVGMFYCHHGGGMQGWVVETAAGDSATVSRASDPEDTFVRFRHATTMKGAAKCISGDAAAGGSARLDFCRRGGDGLLWRFDARAKQLVNKKSGLCLDAVRGPPHKRDPVVLSPCDSAARFMQWRLTEIGSVPCTQKWCKMNYTFS
eukprot:m.1053199 g.1053199  ORF g.1053199 m.1053199 type:complete len:537 (+) comp24187_c1_seq1:699-2309(+)